ncbi:MAG: LacI family transcriptional regulator [Chloroflexi bacterium]|nr:MAG: LacI family transcriptional regulator [Chloroflexota bacterium]
MATLHDVAKRAGVSTATVSKVLSNTPYFTDTTRDKVMAAVEELGYTPNLAARALSSGKSHIIAVVFPYVFEAIFEDPLVLRILEGIESESRERGYNLLLSTPRLTKDNADPHYQQLIASGYVDGVIALDNLPSISALEPAHKRKIPAVAIGYHETDYCVRSDDFSGGQQLLQHLVAFGHRDIGIIAVPEETHFSITHRLRGVRAAADEAGIDYDAMPRADGDFGIASGDKATKTLLTEHPELTALLCLNDRMAMGAIQQIRNMGLDVPSDISVVGYDDIPAAAIVAPPLTTINQQAPELGRAAAKMLFDILDGHKPERVEMPTHLIVRESAAAPR